MTNTWAHSNASFINGSQAEAEECGYCFHSEQFFIEEEEEEEEECIRSDRRTPFAFFTKLWNFTRYRIAFRPFNFPRYYSTDIKLFTRLFFSLYRFIDRGLTNIGARVSIDSRLRVEKRRKEVERKVFAKVLNKNRCWNKVRLDRLLRPRRTVSAAFRFRGEENWTRSLGQSKGGAQRDTAFVPLMNQIQGREECKPCNFPGWRARFSTATLPAEMLRVGQTSLRSRIAVEFRSLHSIVKGCLQFTYYAPVCIARRSVSEEERRLDATQVRNPLGKIVSAGKKERKREDVRGEKAGAWPRNSENRKGGEQREPPVNLFVTWTFA